MEGRTFRFPGQIFFKTFCSVTFSYERDESLDSSHTVQINKYREANLVPTCYSDAQTFKKRQLTKRELNGKAFFPPNPQILNILFLPFLLVLILYSKRHSSADRSDRKHSCKESLVQVHTEVTNTGKSSQTTAWSTVSAFRSL